MPEADTEGGRYAGPYRLLDKLGHGGFGEVFLAEAPGGERAAVKLLRTSWAGDSEVRRRFTAEVEQARRVSDFCVAAILDADPGAEQPWIASEYIDGPTLEAAVREWGPRRGADLHRLAVSSATALAAIHGSGVVHRDLKPANILLARDGPRVIDFGIARAIEAGSMTASGIIGTIGYMAPEQLEGGRLTPAVDVFAWGAVLVYAATGRAPFAAPTQTARIARVLTGEPDTGDLGEPLLSVALACLEKSPDRRPDARGLLDMLLGTAAPEEPGAQRPAGEPAEGEQAHTADRETRIGPAATLVETAEQEHPAGEPEPAGGPPGTGGDAEDASSPLPAESEGAPAGVPPTDRRAEPPTAPGGSTGQWDDAVEQPSPGQSAPAESRDFSGPRAGGTDGRTAAGKPPYWFAGSRYTDPGRLAEAMQRDWTRAVQVFSDDEERAALGSWMIDDIGDTATDRSVYRRRPGDANLAVAWFVAQLRPDLPPVFRGGDASLEGLRRRFADVGPAFTGAPTDNELVLAARADVLRVLALHETAADGLGALADDLATAERAAVSFRDRLEQAVPRLGQRAAVDSALILRLLLNDRWFTLAADDGAEAAEWVEALWSAVQREQGAAYVGATVAAASADGELRESARRYAEWSSALAKAERECAEAAESWNFQHRLHLVGRWLAFTPWLFGLGALAVVVLATSQDPGTAFGVFMLGTLLWGTGRIVIAFGTLHSGPHGVAAQERFYRLRNHAVGLRREVDRMRAELEAVRTMDESA